MFFRLITKFLQVSCSHSALCKNAILYSKLNVLDPSTYQIAGQDLGV